MVVVNVKPMDNVGRVMAGGDRQEKLIYWSHFENLQKKDIIVFERIQEKLEEKCEGFNYWAVGVSRKHNTKGTYYCFEAECVNLVKAQVVGYVHIKVYENPEGYIKILEVEAVDNIKCHKM